MVVPSQRPSAGLLRHRGVLFIGQGGEIASFTSVQSPALSGTALRAAGLALDLVVAALWQHERGAADALGAATSPPSRCLRLDAPGRRSRSSRTSGLPTPPAGRRPPRATSADRDFWSPAGRELVLPPSPLSSDSPEPGRLRPGLFATPPHGAARGESGPQRFASSMLADPAARLVRYSPPHAVLPGGSA